MGLTKVFHEASLFVPQQKLAAPLFCLEKKLACLQGWCPLYSFPLKESLALGVAKGGSTEKGPCLCLGVFVFFGVGEVRGK